MSDKQVLLLASGGHGSVVLDALLQSGVHVSGIIDPGFSVGTKVFNVSVLGDEEQLQQTNPVETLLVNGAGVASYGDLRARLFTRWKERGFKFVSVRHPSAVIGQEVILSEGSQVMAGAVLQCRVTVGMNAVINTRASVDHDCRIEAHAFIAPGAILCGNVTIEENAFVGAGAVVLPGTRVGAGATVGAGAVVLRDVRSGDLVVGSPATIKKRRLP